MRWTDDSPPRTDPASHHDVRLRARGMALWYVSVRNRDACIVAVGLSGPSGTGRKPTMMSDEEPVSMAEGTMPWQLDDKGQPASDKFKYQYHPGGDPNRGTKNAPSALHSVIVPNVNLPKVGSPTDCFQLRSVGSFWHARSIWAD